MSSLPKFENLHTDLYRLWSIQLLKEWENVCFQYGVDLPKPSLEISESKSIYGSWTSGLRKISISSHLIRNHSWDHVLEVLKHEMAHQMVNEYYGSLDTTHGFLFDKACKKLGVSAWASKATGSLPEGIAPSEQRVLCEEDEKLLKRAEKLLALAASDNENEALLAMERVRELYTKHNLKKIKNKIHNDYSYRIINHKKKRASQTQAIIAGIISENYFVDVIFSSLYDPSVNESHKTLEIFGTAENVEMAEYVYHFLFNNLPKLWSKYKKQTGVSAKSKKSYIHGVLYGFSEKLKIQKGELKKASSNGKWGLQISMDQGLDIYKRELWQYINKRHPKIHNKTYRGKGLEKDSYEKGKAAGRSLNIHKGLHKKSSGAMKFLN